MAKQHISVDIEEIYAYNKHIEYFRCVYCLRSIYADFTGDMVVFSKPNTCHEMA